MGSGSDGSVARTCPRHKQSGGREKNNKTEDRKLQSCNLNMQIESVTPQLIIGDEFCVVTS